MTGATLMRAGERMAKLRLITQTQAGDWAIKEQADPDDAGHAWVIATHRETGCRIDLISPDVTEEDGHGAGAFLDAPGLGPTEKRGRMFRAGGGALGYLLTRELHTFRRRNEARKAEAAVHS